MREKWYSENVTTRFVWLTHFFGFDFSTRGPHCRVPRQPVGLPSPKRSSSKCDTRHSVKFPTGLVHTDRAYFSRTTYIRVNGVKPPFKLGESVNCITRKVMETETSVQHGSSVAWLEETNFEIINRIFRKLKSTPFCSSFTFVSPYKFKMEIIYEISTNVEIKVESFIKIENLRWKLFTTF